MRKAALAARRARAVAGLHARPYCCAAMAPRRRAHYSSGPVAVAYTLLYASGFQVKAQKYCAARAENIGTSESSMPR